jgi:hypothetical protein
VTEFWLIICFDRWPLDECSFPTKEKEPSRSQKKFELFFLKNTDEYFAPLCETGGQCYFHYFWRFSPIFGETIGDFPTNQITFDA